MLQLVEEFSLATIFEKIPKQQLKIPAECVKKTFDNHSKDKYLFSFKYPFLKDKPKDEDVELLLSNCGLSIVGHDREGSILIARYGYCSDVNDIVTYIDCYNMKKSTLHTVHRLSVMRCVGCSINFDKTLLAFTKRDLKTDRLDGEPIKSDYYYESAVAEVTGRKRTVTLKKITKDNQSIQFVCPPIKKSRVEQIDTICYLYQGKLSIHQILTYLIPNQNVCDIQTIKENSKGKEKVDQVVWYQWLPQKPLLYLLEDVNKKAIGPPSYNLVCFNFAERTGKATLSFKTPINLKISPGDKLTVVKLGSGDESNIVLCKQHAYQNSCPFVPIALYLIHHDAVLEFPIYLTEDSVISEVVIYFDSLGDLLLVYIPGYYFQLIYCPLDEEPKLGLCFTGPEFATPLLNQTPGKTVKIVSFNSDKDHFTLNILGKNTNINSTQKIHTFLDSKSGIVYRYRFNREAILRIFAQPSKMLHVQALNLAVVYMQDWELLDEIIIQACTNIPDSTSSEFFKEYLLATSYEMFLRLINGAKLCASFMPLSSLPSVKDSTKGIQNAGVTGHIEYKPFQFTTKKTKIKTRFKYPLDIPNIVTPTKGLVSVHSSPQLHLPTLSSSSSPSSPYKMPLRTGSVGSLSESNPGIGHNPESSVGKFLGRIFSNFLGNHDDDDPNSSPIDKPEKKPEEIALDPHGSRIIENLTAFIFHHLAKDSKVIKRSQCHQLAQEYRIIQEKQVNTLYECILTASSEEEQDDFKLFERLCNLHCAIEELWFPYPRNFKEYLTDLGYKCLKKNVFLQFVERGVFEISASFVNKILNNESQEDKKFKYLLLSKLPSEEDSIQSLERFRDDDDKEEQIDFLIEHKARKHINNQKEAIDMESMLTADFLPLEIYLEGLKNENCSSEEIIWFSKNANSLYSNTFKLSNNC